MSMRLIANLPILTFTHNVVYFSVFEM